MSNPTAIVGPFQRSIASVTAFRAQPADPTSWTQVGSTAVWYATYPSECAARSPEEVWYNNLKYTRVNRLDELTRTGTWFYDGANKRLYLDTGADPSTNVVCKMLLKGLKGFRIVNPSANIQTINWTADGSTPSSTVGEALAPSQDTGIIPFQGSAYDIQIKAQSADSGKSISIALFA